MKEDSNQAKRSLSKKISSRRIKRAIKRRRKARSVTYLYDSSLPRSMMFSGVINRARKKRGKLPVRVGGHELSPFVVELKKDLPQPSELMEMEPVSVAAPNLLEGQTHKAAKRVSNEELTDDLMLEMEDVAGQLTEDIAASVASAGRWILPRQNVNVQHITLDKQSIHKPRHPEQFAEQFATEGLNPHRDGVSATDYFTLPETEEEEPAESELVSFDEIVAEQPDLTVNEAPEESADEPERDHDPQPKVNLPKPSFSFFKLPKLSKIVFQLPDGWARAVGVFVLFSFVFVLPIYAMTAVNELRHMKNDLTNQGNAAVGQLQDGAGAAMVRDVEGASNAFAQAHKTFQNANKNIEQLGAGTSVLISSLPGTKKYYKTGKTLVKTGESLSLAGERITEGFAAMNEEVNPTVTSRLAILRTYMNPALKHMKAAEANLERIDSSILPEQQRQKLDQMKTRLPTVVSGLEEFMEFSDMALTVLGDEKKKRYLVVFQNNTELRPTGGFMGSFAEVDIKDGEVVDMNIPGGGTYDLQGQLKDRVVAPKPLRLLRARWEFQDANWFPDFPSSARQMLDLHEAAGGPTVDGVIAVNATYVANLLKLTGPIEMPEYGRTINADNFIQETQKIVEIEYDKEENKPKAFIGDLAPKLIERVKEKTGEDFLSVVEYLNHGLTRRDVQIYFTKNELQSKITELGWGGSLKFTEGDYLMVVDTNLGGGKTDGLIGQRVDMDVNIAPDGSIENTVKVTRTHYGDKNDTFGGVNNVNYLRLLVPKGSELISSSGFTRPDKSLFEQPGNKWRIDEDIAYQNQTKTTDPITKTVTYNASGKTVFGNWVQTKPGTSSTATFTYKLPFKVDVLDVQSQDVIERIKTAVGVPATDRYTLTIQQQSGVLDRTYNVDIDAPSEIQPVWSTHDLEGTVIKKREDAFMATLFERKQ
jgi:hypothetical protein